ncbi:MAG: hypothetical protein ABR953_14025 [Candidatus Acidiferrales bacterium]|jgi:hypothetical protein
MMTRQRIELLSLATIAAAALLVLAACGGGSSTTPTPPPPPSASGPVTIFPGTATVPVNGTAHFQAFLASAPTATFTWSVSSGSGNGTIDSNGVYAAPSSIPSPAAVTITATSSGATGTATINIVAAPSGGLAIDPSVVVVPAGQTFTFSATANGNPVTPTWQVNAITGGDSANGLISASGVYTAPFTPPSGGSTIVTAESGGNSATATVVVVFSNASLSGQYAFSYSGQDSKGPLLVAGSFTANSSAASISGIEDYNSTEQAPAQASPVSGTFSVNPDGSATATLTDTAAGGSETWDLALVASPQGQASPRALLVRFDKTATGSGEADLQNTTKFALSAFDGNYAFNLSGNNGSGKPLQITGMLQADGFGTIPVNFAEEDINDAGTNTEDGADLSLHGTFVGSANLGANGRGTLTLTNTSTEIAGTYTFAFYIVDNTHLKVVETDAKATAQLSGDLFSAPNTDGSFSTSILKGSYAFTLGGANVGGTASYAIGGVLVTNGTGSISGGVFDVNSGGSVTADTSVTSSYSVASSLGRITFTLTNGSTTRNFAGYATSSGSVEIIELDTDILANGTAYLQTSTGIPEGSFALNLTSNANTSGFTEEDVIGQVAVPGGVVVPQGNIDIDDKGTVTTGAPIETTSTIGAPDSNGRGTTMLETHSANYSLAYYVVSNGAALAIEIDGQRVAAGIAVRQF